MKWLKYVLLTGWFLLTLPMWRLLDWAVVTIPNNVFFAGLMTIWAALFIALPLRIATKKIPGYALIALIPLLTSLAYLSGPLSGMATMDPTLTQCGRMTYSGFFYPIREFLSDSHEDDLDLRNQMCWVRKMIRKAPDKLSAEDLDLHLDLLKKNLLKPSYKYRVTLPGVLFLVGTYLSAGLDESNAFERTMKGKRFVESLEFWSQQYSEEVSSRTYSWYEWPHSGLIQFEYGFIERNWENIHLEFNQ